MQLIEGHTAYVRNSKGVAEVVIEEIGATKDHRQYARVSGINGMILGDYVHSNWQAAYVSKPCPDAEDLARIGKIAARFPHWRKR